MIILFVIAMKVELLYLLDKLKHHKIELGDYTYYIAKHQDKTIYILHSGIGLINTSISLTKFLNKIKLKPDLIINAGTAGAHHENLNVGDIVLAKEVININSIETVFKKENEGSNSLEWKLNTFLEDELEKNLENNVKVYYGDESLLKKIKDIGIDSKVEIYDGRVGSGDIWNKEIDRIKYFNDKYSTLCEEMEIYSVYTICEQENIPCAGIKIISNNGISGKSYDTSVTEKLDKFLYKIILEL